jgi:2-phospho-L-lactate guanylyltransferase
MNRWLLVPVKPLAESKSRLAPVLKPGERIVLMRQLLLRTLALARDSSLFSCMLVISRDPLVWELGRGAGARVLPELGDELNSALAQGAEYAWACGARSALVLPADLPLLRREDLAALCALGETGDGAVIGCAQDGGTNALHLRLPPALPFCFGEKSCARHQAAARAAGLTPQVYDSATLRFDLDQPEQWLALTSLSQGSL